MRIRAAALAVIGCSLLLTQTLPALAQNQAPAQPSNAAPAQSRIRGTVVSFNGKTLKMNSIDMQSLTINVAPDLVVSGMVKRKLSDIKPGDFVGSAAMFGKDGKLHAMEVHIFPENMRGTGEGHRPMDIGPDTSMTNATVGTVTKSADGPVLSLTYKGGANKIVVAPGTPIVAFVPGNPAMIKAGAPISVTAFKTGDSLITHRIVVGLHGVKPPL